MDSGQHTVEVTGLCPKATEKDVFDFFAFSGAIEYVEIVRSGGNPCTAYVTFKNAYSVETAVLLSGAALLDQRVCITPWGQNECDYQSWDWDSHTSSGEGGSIVPSAGEAVAMVKAMLANGYKLGTTALLKAKEFDESHQLSARAARKVADVSHNIGLTDKLCAGFEAVKSIDNAYMYGLASSALSATGRTATTAASAVVESSYFSKGALLVSDALARASKAAADLGNHSSAGQREG